MSYYHAAPDAKWHYEIHFFNDDPPRYAYLHGRYDTKQEAIDALNKINNDPNYIQKHYPGKTGRFSMSGPTPDSILK